MSKKYVNGVIIGICYIILILFIEHIAKKSFADTNLIGRKSACAIMKKNKGEIRQWASPKLMKDIERLNYSEEGIDSLALAYSGFNDNDMDLVAFFKIGYNKVVATYVIGSERFLYTVVLSRVGYLYSIWEKLQDFLYHRSLSNKFLYAITKWMKPYELPDKWALSDFYTEDDVESIVVKHGKRVEEYNKMSEHEKLMDLKIRLEEAKIKVKEFMDRKDESLEKFWELEDSFSYIEKIEQYKRTKAFYLEEKK